MRVMKHDNPVRQRRPAVTARVAAECVLSRSGSHQRGRFPVLFGKIPKRWVRPCVILILYLMVLPIQVVFSITT